MYSALAPHLDEPVSPAFEASVLELLHVPSYMELFREPVIRLFPKLREIYLSLVNRPCCFEEIERNINSHRKYTRVGELAYHLFLVANNSFRFNKKPETTLEKLQSSMEITPVLATTVDYVMSLYRLFREQYQDLQTVSLSLPDFDSIFTGLQENHFCDVKLRPDPSSRAPRAEGQSRSRRPKPPATPSSSASDSSGETPPPNDDDDGEYNEPPASRRSHRAAVPKRRTVRERPARSGSRSHRAAPEAQQPWEAPPTPFAEEKGYSAMYQSQPAPARAPKGPRSQPAPPKPDYDPHGGYTEVYAPAASEVKHQQTRIQRRHLTGDPRAPAPGGAAAQSADQQKRWTRGDRRGPEMGSEPYSRVLAGHGAPSCATDIAYRNSQLLLARQVMRGLGVSERRSLFAAIRVELGLPRRASADIDLQAYPEHLDAVLAMVISWGEEARRRGGSGGAGERTREFCSAEVQTSILEGASVEGLEGEAGSARDAGRAGNAGDAGATSPAVGVGVANDTQVLAEMRAAAEAAEAGAGTGTGAEVTAGATTGVSAGPNAFFPSGEASVALEVSLPVNAPPAPMQPEAIPADLSAVLPAALPGEFSSGASAGVSAGLSGGSLTGPQSEGQGA